MKHTELLAKITIAGDTSVYMILRAVVELHEPEQVCFDATCYCADNCKSCRSKYPCMTIQAIEKEL